MVFSTHGGVIMPIVDARTHPHADKLHHHHRTHSLGASTLSHGGGPPRQHYSQHFSGAMDAGELKRFRAADASTPPLGLAGGAIVATKKPAKHGKAKGDKLDAALDKAVTSSSTISSSGGKPKKLSTERSRLCRQRQKNYAGTLQASVAALRAEVENLRALRELRHAQVLNAPASRSGSFAKLVREYCAVFEHGMALDTMAEALGRMRSLPTSRQLSAEAQCDFLMAVMDPDVIVYDWMGRSKVGPAPLLFGWKAWSAWHASLTFELENIDVVETEETIVVSTRGHLRVRVSETTVDKLFPHIKRDAALYHKLLGAEIRYPFRDRFFFTEQGRVGKYAVDLDIVSALSAVIRDFRTVLNVITPPNAVSLNDRAVSTYDGCSLVGECVDAPLPPLAPRPRAAEISPKSDDKLKLQFLLS